ncbi:MAG: gamma-glutamyltransferase [Chloroflexota bacterium]|nr:gamma-glutamyltransferase [Chloroflexota bacterium]
MAETSVGTRSEWHVEKTEATASHGMVTADNPLAAEAGLEILKAGGNAVDAAVAAAFAVGVAEPFTSGVGGVAAMVIRRADGHTSVIDGSATAPQSAREDMYEVLSGGERVGMYGWPATKDDANNVGYRAVGVPGTVACLCLALERHGRMDRGTVMRPAIALAENGFEVDWYTALAIGAYAERLWPFPDSRRIFYRPSGAPLRPTTGFDPADRLVQSDLAETLRTIAAKGADGFYRGPIAAAIDADMRANGGLITAEEISDYRARELPALEASYRGDRILTTPGATGAITVVEILNVLEGFDLRGMPSDTARLHLIAEAQRRAFADRFARLADPAFVGGEPFEALASKEFAAERRRSIDPRRADPAAGPAEMARGAVARAAAPGDHTTHVCAVDGDRTLVSLTSTLGQGFGSGVVAKGTGIVLADVMTWFDPRPGGVNSIAPGKRILWAAAPMVVVRNGEPVLVLGAPGGRKIMSAVAQCVVRMVDRDDGPQAAVNRPRVHCEGETTQVDARVGQATLDELDAIGHILDVREETFFSSHFARPSAIAIDRESGLLRAGVPQTKPTLAAGY